MITIGTGDMTEAIGLDQCYPPREASPPDSLDLRGLMPCSYFRHAVPTYAIHDPEKFHIPYKPEVLIIHRFNPMLSQMDPRAVAESLKTFKFIISFVSGQIDETNEFADLIIPEAHDLERWWAFPANTFTAFLPPGPGPWSGQVLQPVVDPPPGVRHVWDFMMDVTERLGLLAETNNLINMKFGLINSEELKLKPDKKYTVEEVAKRSVSLITGKAYPEEWFRDHCSIEFYERTVEEAFPLHFSKARIPVYLEHFIDAGAQVKKLTKELGMDWWDTSYYHPFPEWHPCPAHEVNPEEYDLFIANSKLPLHQWTVLVQNPWVDDISKRNHLDYHILLHSSVAEKKGIKDGDFIWVESETNRVKGRVRVTECVHPEVVGTFSILGQWARDKTFAKGKGVHFNSLVKFDWSMVDTLTGQIDFCAKVKVYKAQD
jgi:anaerobic selenocysteine-containing dehydrogenase